MVRQATMLDLMDLAQDAQETHQRNQGEEAHVEQSVEVMAEVMHIPASELTGTQLAFVEAQRRHSRGGGGSASLGAFSSGRRFKLDTAGREPKFRFG